MTRASRSIHLKEPPAPVLYAQTGDSLDVASCYRGSPVAAEPLLKSRFPEPNNFYSIYAATEWSRGNEIDAVGKQDWAEEDVSIDLDLKKQRWVGRNEGFQKSQNSEWKVPRSIETSL
ncbi:hypothetical protein EG329_008048 [Mollisiaceae sp. DMI_Dod_QoI]|nr:hypothetical protein EG329_008048 [Helotiales sp. DMI_Dod_QoI]